MITRLFRSKKRLDSADPGDRREAVDTLSDEDARNASGTLATLARTDPDLQVRRAALARLTDTATLAGLLDDPELGSAAARRAAALVNRGDALALAEHPAVLLVRLAESPDEALIDALTRQSDEQLLLEAVIAVPREQKARLLDLPVFHRTAVLQTLEHRSRDRDKATNRLARERLERIRAQRATANALIEQLGERLTTLERPTADTSATEAKKRAFLRDAVAKDLTSADAIAAGLAAAGESLAELPALRRRFEALPANVPPADPGPVPASPAARAPETPVADRDAEAPSKPSAPASDAPGFDELALAFESLYASFGTDVPFETLAAERQSLTDAWLARADHEPPAPAQHEVFERVSHRFHELAEAHERLAAMTLPVLDTSLPDRLTADSPAEVWQAAEQLRRATDRAGRLLRQLRWPEWAAQPEALVTLSGSLEASSARLARWQTEVDRLLEEIGGRLKSLEAHLEAGDLKEARGLAGEVRKALKPLPAQLTRPFNRALGRAQAQLGELSDWQTFATSPKREALLSAITELADHPLAPKDQADRIKTLRAEWNALGPPGRAHDHRLMEQFNEAAERAFEPCRAYFAEAAEVRARNLEARRGICESLASYLAATDWQQADYKAAERIMRVARQEWHTFHPVDRNPGKPVEARFEALQQELHDRIKAEWDRNLAAKRAIVAEAEALADSDHDHRERTEAAKTLQRRWKAVGVTPRRPDQTLWQAFRVACDRIFEARDDAVKAAQARVQAGQTEAERLLGAFRARLDNPAGADIEEADLRALQTAFDGLPELPERLRRTVERDYDDLVRAARGLFRDRRLAEERQRLMNLKTLDEAVTALEARQRAGETIDFEPPDPVFAGRCAGTTEPAPIEALTRLVIEAEIAAGLESEEGELRMSIQVEMMNAGRGREALEADPEALTARWCSLGPKDAAADPLRERFFRAIARLGAR
jgi:exonuclease SbcC